MSDDLDERAREVEEYVKRCEAAYDAAALREYEAALADLQVKLAGFIAICIAAGGIALPVIEPGDPRSYIMAPVLFWAAWGIWRDRR